MTYSKSETISPLKQFLTKTDPFDLWMIAAMVLLTIVITAVVLAGDQLGLAVESYGPVDSGSTRPLIQFKVDDPIAAQSVQSRFSITPAIPGTLTIEGNQITFRPSISLKQGDTYLVRLSEGLQGTTGRHLKHDIQWSFHVRSTRIAYLGPVDSPIQNLYLLEHLPEPGQLGQGRQLTNTTKGIRDFDVTPDGDTIVYSELLDNGNASLFTIDLTSGTSKLLYSCTDAMCSAPIFRPDGGAIAFERVGLTTTSDGIRVPGVSRVWVLELKTGAAKPLFTDNQELGYSPRWSPDGNLLAVFNQNAGGISIYNFKTQQVMTIPTLQGEIGQFSPDGKWMFFPKIVQQDDGSSVSHYVLADVTNSMLVQTDLLADNNPINEKEAIWSSDGKQLFMMRPQPGTQGLGSPQLYEVDVASGTATLLLDEQNYSSGSLILSPDGNQLLFQRFPLNKPGSRIQVWLYDLTTKRLQQVVENATFARWVP